MARDPAVTSRIMSKIRRSGGKAETLLGKTMWSLGLRYRKQHPILGRPDYVFKRARIAVFCDGDFWHGRDLEEQVRKGRISRNRDFWVEKIRRNRERDVEVSTALEQDGWVVLRFWETDIMRDPLVCATIVLETYLRRVEELGLSTHLTRS